MAAGDHPQERTIPGAGGGGDIPQPHLLLQLADFRGEVVDADAGLLQLLVGSTHHVAVPLSRLLGVLQLEDKTGEGLASPAPSAHRHPAGQGGERIGEGGGCLLTFAP